MSRCKAPTSERGGFLVGSRTSERGGNAADGRFATVPTGPLGEQPIIQILDQHNLKPQDIVRASTEQLTFKMLARAVKGRRLTPHMQNKILKAVNTASGQTFLRQDLFNY